MHAAAGILTARGGMTSHAAVVARGMGRPCVSGASALRIDLEQRTLSAGGITLKEGDIITIDGSTGQVIQGEVAMRQPELTGDFANAHGVGRRRAPHESPHQCRHARATPPRRANSAPRASACAAPSTCSSTRTGSWPCAR